MIESRGEREERRGGGGGAEERDRKREREREWGGGGGGGSVCFGGRSAHFIFSTMTIHRKYSGCP